MKAICITQLCRRRHGTLSSTSRDQRDLIIHQDSGSTSGNGRYISVWSRYNRTLPVINYDCRYIGTSTNHQAVTASANYITVMLGKRAKCQNTNVACSIAF